ncbi:MAG: hypothetical protein JXR44_06520 [Thiotrichales bacterium]|nr:hypothetical protein [Thiotrichales bacterium]
MNNIVLQSSVSRFKPAMRHSIFSATLLALMIGLSGCGGSDQKVNLQPTAATEDQQAATRGSVIMDFANGDIPFPHDALFLGSEDGTLNLPVANASDFSDPRVALNTLDGFSTSAPISFKVSKALEVRDQNLNGVIDGLETSVRLYRLGVDAQGRPTVEATLQLGVDYFVTVADAQSEAKNVAILPLRPLAAQSQYLITVNQALIDQNGQALGKSLIYQALSSAQPLPDSLQALAPLQQLTLAQLNALQQQGQTVDNVIASWSFRTQSIATVLNELQKKQTANQSLELADSGLDTRAVGASGAAQIWVGKMTLPYYGGVPSQTNPSAPLSQFWRAENGGFLTAFNPQVQTQTQQTIPVLMTVPKVGTKPESGWPVVLFQHGITQNRTNLLAVADALAAAGFAAVAIDMPLHGVTDSQNPFYAANTERTFNVDYDGVAGADPSGNYFINFRNLLVTRDNLRQAVADLIELRSALENHASAGLLDTAQLSFVGHSLGAMVGAVYQSLQPSDAAVYAMPGTQMAYLLAGSANFGPVIAQGLQAQGIEVGSAAYQQFLLVAQTVVDSADPVNALQNLANPSLLLSVVGDGAANLPDQTIPNRVFGAPLAGTEPWIALQALPAVSDSQALPAGKGVLRFTDGDHASILSPAASPIVTQTMQEAMASFLQSRGMAVQVSQNSDLQ